MKRGLAIFTYRGGGDFVVTGEELFRVEGGDKLGRFKNRFRIIFVF